MDELIKGIVGLYTGAGGASLRGFTPGGMWLSQAPQNATGAYIVIVPVSAPVSYAMGTSATKVYTQECNIQFTISTLNGTASDVAAAMTSLAALYDFCTISMSTKSLLVARRMNNQGPVRDDDTRGYLGYIEYRFTIGG